MPTYQYACTACGEKLEVVQKFSDDPLTECPSCHGRLRKLFSSVGVVFKGSGFYKTDSRSSAGTSTSGSTGSKESTSTETKASPSSESPSSSSGDTGSTGSSGTSSGGDSKVA